MFGVEQGAGPKVVIDFEPIGKRLYASLGQTVMQAAQGLELFEHGIGAPCGGKGLCARCLVRLVHGKLSPLTLTEERGLTKEQIEHGYRLACQAKVAGPCKLEIPVASLVGRQQLKVEGCQANVAPDWCLERYLVTGIRTPTIHYPHSLWQQIEKFLKEEYNQTDLQVNMNLLRRTDPAHYGNKVCVVVSGKEIVAVTAPGSDYEPLGVAVDLGTTKIAAFLVKLETGEVIASEGILNPQIAYGEDVMSRLAYAMESEENANHLAAAAVNGINQLIDMLILHHNFGIEQVRQAVIAANTAMHHLLLGLPVKQLAMSPYIPVTTAPVETTGDTIGLRLGCQAKVYIVPPAGGFVGGDHVTMIQASGIDRLNSVTLGIDIGTNTEIVLAVNGRMTSCSCASGPAFEGAHIYHGMRAVNGAISYVELLNNGQEVVWQTIGGEKPIGFCGSGIIDAVAGLIRCGIIVANGRLNPDHVRVRAESGKPAEFVVVPKHDNGLDVDIVITQKDIGEIQLAKAAIASGISLLLKTQGINEADIDKVIVAGAFGSFLRLESAIAVGMLPNLPLERFAQVGNAAGTGAIMTLLSSKERCRAETIARKVEHIELAVLPEFKREFAKALKFSVL